MYLINLKTLKTLEVPVTPTIYDYMNRKVTLKAGPFNPINTKDYDAFLTFVNKSKNVKSVASSEYPIKVQADSNP